MNLVGLSRLELPTSPLSGVRSKPAELQTQYPCDCAKKNQLSPARNRLCFFISNQFNLCEHSQHNLHLIVKEVIQPQVPLRLPCYDFTPVMNHTVVNALPKVKLSTSGAAHSHGVTGGVYKARERIHRDILIHDY